jgi:predicted enzyme related to lactoylglutathione lyase
MTFDCANAETQREFWSQVLGYEISRGVYTILRDPKGERLSVYMQEVPEPRVAKNRVHVDLVSDDYSNDVERIVSLGGKVVQEIDENDTVWTVFEDPEGNAFCLFKS